MRKRKVTYEMSLTYLLLVLTIITSLFVRDRWLLFSFTLVCAWSAFGQNYLTYTGFAALAGVTALTYSGYSLPPNSGMQKSVLLTLAVLVGSLILHNVDGFNNTIIFNKIFVTTNAKSYTMYFNVDKIFTALLIYICGYLAIAEKSINEKAIIDTVIILAACITVILGPAVLSGYIKYEPKIPDVMSMWMINNFLFVCFSEEVIFRGFVQNTLMQWLPKKKKSTMIAIVTASIIFGLYHYRDGYIYIALATICGMFYGYAYYKTKRILCSMLVHFFLNFTHIVLFTYPVSI